MFSIIGQYTVLFFHFLYFSVCQVAVGLYHAWTVFFDNFGEILFVRYAQLIFADAARHGCHGNGAVKVASYDPVTGNPVYQSQPAPDRYYSVGLSATLPLYFQRGYHTRQLSLSAGWNYSNGMVADLNKIEWENGSIHNIQRIGFNEGLHKLSFGAGFSDQVRLAHRDFAPRWGYALNASYTFDPANADFSNLVSFYGQSYLPGFAPHHSVLLAATYQTSVGGYKFPAGYAPLSYKSTRLIPHGFTSSEIVSNDYTALSLDYQLPVWYPEGGIGSVLYFKRIRLNAGGDYAQFRRPAGSGMEWRRIWSVGGA